MNTDEQIKVEKKNNIGIVVLNRPEVMNSLDTKTLKKLDTALRDLEKDKEIRAVIITGTRVFCAGADIKELKDKTPAEAELFLRLGHRVFDHLENMEKPVIAAINCYAVGGGCELALACDIRIAGMSAKLGQPEINLGLIPGFGGTQRLPGLVGTGRAMEMILTGRNIGAKEALNIGLINQVVRDEELMEKAEEMARVLAEKSPVAIRIAKNLINRDLEMRNRLEEEIVSLSRCFASEDHVEGINAFFEKRKPVFKGV